MVFLALHHLLVVSSAIREAGGVNDVVEDVDGQVEEFQVGLCDPRAPGGRRRLQSGAPLNWKMVGLSLCLKKHLNIGLRFPIH